MSGWSLRGAWIIARRELGAYLDAPIGIVFLDTFAVITLWLFSGSFFLAERADLRALFGLLPQVMVVFVPAITMRLWAEDHRQGTSELLLTLPIPAPQVVLGKFAASVAFLALALATTLPAVVSVALLGDLDWGPVIGGYVGALVMGCLYLALGLFASGLVRDQVIAFVLAFVLCFALFLLGTDLIALQLDSWTGGAGSFLQRYVGLAGRFAAIERGVLDTGDLLYFAAGTALFLLLNVVWIRVRVQPGAWRSLGVAAALLVPCAVLAVMVVEPLRLPRVDLTEDDLYTLSPQSRAMLRELDAPVQATLYVSPAERLPAGMKTVPRDAEDLLDELARASGGTLRYTVVRIDPEALRPEEQEDGEGPAPSAEEDLAEQLLRDGVRPFEVQSVEADGYGVTLVYSAIKLAYKDRPEQVVPRLTPRSMPMLEYELMMRVDRLRRASKPKVALLAPVERQPVEPALAKVYRDMGKPVPDRRVDHFSILEAALKRREYTVHRLERFGEDRAIPEDADLVVALAPDGWSELQVAQLGAALRRGQPVLLATQRYRGVYQPYRGRYKVRAEPTGTAVEPLLRAAGLGLEDAWLMDRSSEAVTVVGTSMMAAQIQRPAPVELDTHVLVRDSGVDREAPITRRLGSLLAMWPTALTVEPAVQEAAGLRTAALLWSSAESWLVAPHGGNLKPPDIAPPAQFSGPYPLALLVEGTFGEVYAGRTWAELDERVRAQVVVAEDEARPSRLLVIGCDELLRDRYIRAADNGRLALNAVEALAVGEELMGIGDKRPVDRRIERVPARARVLHRVLVMTAVPLLMTAAALARFLVIRRRKQRAAAPIGRGDPR